MAEVITVYPSGFVSQSTVTDDPSHFLRDIYTLVGNGCDIVQHLSLSEGIHILFDEEPFLRTPVPEGNPRMIPAQRNLGIPPHRISGAVVFVGETPDGGDLAGLTPEQITRVNAALA